MENAKLCKRTVLLQLPHFLRVDLHQLFFAGWVSYYFDDTVLTADTTLRNSSTVARVTNSGTAMSGVVSGESRQHSRGLPSPILNSAKRLDIKQISS